MKIENATRTVSKGHYESLFSFSSPIYIYRYTHCAKMSGLYKTQPLEFVTPSRRFIVLLLAGTFRTNIVCPFRNLFAVVSYVMDFTFYFTLPVFSYIQTRGDKCRDCKSRVQEFVRRLLLNYVHRIFSSGQNYY